MKRKSSARVEPAHKLVGPAAQEIVQAAADRVGPFVQQAADRVGPLAHSAADRINAAADALSPYAQSAADRIGPLAHTAADRVGPLAQSAADRVGPLAHQAVDRVTPYTQQAVELVSPYAQHAADLVAPYTAKVGPYASSARQRGAQVAHDAVEALAPRLDEAFDRVSPAVEAARGKVTDELLPRLGEALTAAAATPVAVEAAKRGKATMAAARGELSLPEPKKKGRWLRRFAIIAAVAGVAAVVLRRVLGDKDADWQAARPTTPYAPSTPAAASPASAAPDASSTTTAVTEDVSDGASGQPVGLATADLSAEESSGSEGAGALDDAVGDAVVDDSVLNDSVASDTGAGDAGTAGTGTSETLGSDIVTDADLVAEENVLSDDAPVVADLPTDAVEQSAQTPLVDEPDGTPEQLAPAGASTEDTNDAEAGAAEGATTYTGEGAYVGTEPPEGFFIKGNENSMKYHLPESGGYDETIAEVWFSSEEAAQQAGFVRAQG